MIGRRPGSDRIATNHGRNRADNSWQEPDQPAQPPRETNPLATGDKPPLSLPHIWAARNRPEVSVATVVEKRRYCPTFSIGEARHIVQDLFEPNPAIYWTDFLGSLVLGLASFLALPRVPLVLGGPAAALAMALLYAVSVVAVYRAVLFTHELTHLKQGRLKGFKLVWNLTCGIPFLIPSVLYETHVVHHARRHYGTHEDGEYLPFARRSPGLILFFLAQPFVVPLLAPIRFGLLTPLAWLSPAFRRWVYRHASSMVIDPAYCRPLPTNSQLRLWRLQEAACFVCCLSTALGTALGTVPWHFVPRAYLTAVGVLMLNNIRTLGAHRYRNEDGEMTFTDQLLDSVNFPQNPISGELWGPVGLRFHGLHHLFPSMPYHNLGIAHRRLMAELPASSPYRRTVSDSLLGTIRQIWRESRAAARAGAGAFHPANSWD